MAARKKAVKKVVKRKSLAKDIKKEIQPDYMVQLTEPKMLRKDLLESLREVIIFMQGYEKFRKIQEEKVAMFNSLKLDIKSLNSLINDKLRKYLPKGKLRAVLPQQKEAEPFSHDNEMLNETLPRREVSSPVNQPPKREAPGGLMELEYQLKDIERQLQSIK